METKHPRPHTMTRDAWVRYYVEQAWRAELGEACTYDDIARTGLHHPAAINALDDHADDVEAALAEGLPVSPEVLADYPGLARATTGAARHALTRWRPRSALWP
jgi:hypothetical protein